MLPESLKGALEKLDAGRYRAATAIRRAFGAKPAVPPGKEADELIARKDSLSLLIAQPGWKLVLERVAERKAQAFKRWVDGNAVEDGADLRARVSELDDLLRWVESEIDVGVEVETALERGKN